MWSFAWKPLSSPTPLKYSGKSLSRVSYSWHYRIYLNRRRLRIDAALETQNINRRRPRIDAASTVRRLFEETMIYNNY